MGIETLFGKSWVTARIDDIVNWGRSNSPWPYIFGTACCAIEFMSAASSHFDIARFGAELIRWSPRQADVLIVAGTISYKQAPALQADLRADVRTQMGHCRGRLLLHGRHV